MLSPNGLNGRRRIKNLIATWVRFGEFLKTSLGKEGVQKSQEEEFLRLKAKIAHLLPILTVIEKGQSIDPEALAAVRDITEMLNSFTTLATPEPLTREDTEEIIAQWHTIFIFLNKLEGALKDRRSGFLPRGAGAGVQEGWFTRISTNSLARFVVSLIIIVAAGALVAGLLGITVEQAKETLDKGVSTVLGQRSPGAETDVSHPGSSPAGAARESVAVAGTREETGAEVGAKDEGTRAGVARAFVEEESAIPVALRPLVRQYGKHLTMIVFAAFLAGIVFLFFVRVR